MKEKTLVMRKKTKKDADENKDNKTGHMNLKKIAKKE